MIAILLARQIAELFLIIFVGYLLIKTKLLNERDSKAISTIVLYIINPCVILEAFQGDFSGDIVEGLILSFVVAFVINVIYLFVVMILGKIFHMSGIEKASTIYTNAGNLIIPIVIALFGKEWVVYTTGFIIVQILFMWTHGRMIVCNQKQLYLKFLLKNINIIASLLGIVLFAFQIKIPDFFLETMSSMSAMVGPMCMLVAGMLIGGMDVKKYVFNKRIYLITFIKMIVVPLVGLAVLKIFQMTIQIPNVDMILMVSLLAAVGPTAASITQMAQVYDKEPEYASAYYFTTTLSCIATMPLMVWLFQII